MSTPHDDGDDLPRQSSGDASEQLRTTARPKSRLASNGNKIPDPRPRPGVISFLVVAWIMIACSTPEQVPELINFEQYFAALQRSDFTTRYGIVEFTIRYDRGRLQLTSGEEVFLQRHDETFRIERVTGGLNDDALRERTDSILAYLQRFKILLIRHRAGPDYVLIFDRRGFDPATLPEVEVVHPPHGDEHIPVGVLLFAPGGVAESPSLVVRKSTRIADDWFYHEGEVLHQFAPE